MKGILLVDKPTDWTSFDVVNYVRKMVAGIEGKKPRNVKVGHSGTLDPAATGLLVLCISKEYTSKMPELIKQDKTYLVELTLGFNSTTGDKEGTITPQSHEKPDKFVLEQVIKSFEGESLQTPPAFSAIKVNGKRAYALARAGKPVEMTPRKVTIYSLKNVMYDYPKITFCAHVGSGTYIRSLAQDIGEKLGVGAYMSELRRTAIGDFSIDNAHQLTTLKKSDLEKHLNLTDKSAIIQLKNDRNDD